MKRDAVAGLGIIAFALVVGFQVGSWTTERNTSDKLENAASQVSVQFDDRGIDLDDCVIGIGSPGSDLNGQLRYVSNNTNEIQRLKDYFNVEANIQSADYIVIETQQWPNGSAMTLAIVEPGKQVVVYPLVQNAPAFAPALELVTKLCILDGLSQNGNPIP